MAFILKHAHAPTLSSVCARMSEFVACSYRLLRSLILERDKEPSVPRTVPSLPPHNQPWSRETKPFDWGRTRSSAGLSDWQSQDWDRYWNLLTTWAQLPFGPHNRLLARLQENPEESSLTGQKRRKKKEVWQFSQSWDPDLFRSGIYAYDVSI